MYGGDKIFGIHSRDCRFCAFHTAPCSGVLRSIPQGVLWCWRGDPFVQPADLALKILFALDSREVRGEAGFTGCLSLMLNNFTPVF